MTDDQHRRNEKPGDSNTLVGVPDHPVAAGIGAATAAAAGAVAGAAGGPLGAAIGAAAGALIGGLGGDAVASSVEQIPDADTATGIDERDDERLDAHRMARPVDPDRC